MLQLKMTNLERTLGRKWFQMKNSGEGQGKSRCPNRSGDGNGIG